MFYPTNKKIGKSIPSFSLTTPALNISRAAVANLFRRGGGQIFFAYTFPRANHVLHYFSILITCYRNLAFRKIMYHSVIRNCDKIAMNTSNSHHKNTDYSLINGANYKPQNSTLLVVT